VIAVAHSCLVLLASSGPGAINSSLPKLPALIWLALAWSWFLWPPLLLVSIGRTRAVFVALLVGTALIVSCVPEIFALTSWLVHGFAP
jgi:hypothetical protein